jgi:hypothetical protein
MRVIITGSRRWWDYKTIRTRLAELPTPSTIVHGAATGADAMAHSAALALGHTPEPHFPDYETYSVRQAPTRRNQDMVDLGADLCLVFPTKESVGSWDCKRRAEAAGIPIEVVQR